MGTNGGNEPTAEPREPTPPPDDDGVDEASEESFPSSDPPSTGMPAVSGRSRTTAAT